MRRARRRLARQDGDSRTRADWREMIERGDVDAVAIAAPPRLQPEIAVAALPQGQAGVRREADGGRPPGPRHHAPAAGARPTDDGYEFTADRLLEESQGDARPGRIGRLRHVAVQLERGEPSSTRLRLKQLEDRRRRRRRALGNFARPFAAQLSRMVLRPGRGHCRRGCPACRTIRQRSRPNVTLRARVRVGGGRQLRQ